MRMFAVGDRVYQPQYGPGTVTTVNQYHTVIDFDNHGVRTFVTRIVQLAETTEPAPAKPAKASRKKSRS